MTEEFENTDLENQTEETPEENAQDVQDDKPDDNTADNTPDDAADNSEIYGSPEAYDYSEVQLPEGMTLDNDLLKEFEPIAKKLNLSNKSANELMGLAVKLSEKNIGKFADFAQEMQQAKKEQYLELLNTDKELNTGNKEAYEQYLDVSIQGLNAVATPGFIEVLKAEGLTHHPEFIKTFHAIGKLCTSEKIPDASYPASQKEVDAAEVLYGG